jgi:uncharacterized protein (TIGR00369 family)
MQFPSFNADIAKVLPEYTRSSPYAGLLGIEITDSRPGALVCRIPITPKLGSGVGAVHGGALVSLVDHALSLAVYPLVEIGKWVATLELKMNYLAPVPADATGFIVCEAQVLTLKKHIGVVRADLKFEDRLVATATGTVYVKEPMKR